MPAPNLTSPQKRLLDLALTHWVKQGVWPDRVQVMAWLRAEGLDYKAALSENLWPLARTGDRGPVELTVFGAAAAEGGEPWASYFVPPGRDREGARRPRDRGCVRAPMQRTPGEPPSGQKPIGSRS